MAAHRGSAEADERTPRELTANPVDSFGGFNRHVRHRRGGAARGVLAAQGYAELVDLGRPGRFRPGLIDRQLMTYEAVYMAVLNVTMIGLTLLAARRFGRPATTSLGLKAPEDGWRSYALALLITVAASALWFSVFVKWIPDTVVQDILPYKQLWSGSVVGSCRQSSASWLP